MKILFEVTFAVASTLIVSSCLCVKPPADYLLLDRGYYHKELHRVAKRIESGDWGNDLEAIASKLRLLTDSTLEAVLSRHNEIPKATKIDTSSYDQNRMYQLSTVSLDLLAFYEAPHEEIVDCNNHQVRVFVELIQLVFKSFKRLQKALESPGGSLLVQFMKKYVEKHTRECLTTLVERFDSTVDRLPKLVEQKMDALVAMGENHESEGRDSQLLAQAETLDLARGKFDAKKMLNSLLSTTSYIIEAKTDRKLRSQELGRYLADFIIKTCGEFRSAGIPFDMYNLAKIFAPDAVSSLELPVRFKKLNEYSRICIPFDNYKLERKSITNVVHNVVHQKVLKA